MDRLKSELGGLVGALGNRAVSSVQNKVEDAADRLTDYVEGGGGPGIMAAVTGAKGVAEGKSPVRAMLGAGTAGVKEKIAGLFGKGGKGGKGGGQKLKVTNIVESIDVGVPVRLAYDQWTQFADFPKFMKKVENVDQPEDQKTAWKAQVFWSHRTWESTIMEQVPDERIIWRSKGEKGYVDGAVTFHELTPNLTRILLVLEYHPQGFMEHTGNLWRAQGRRARLELKHFRRHVMTEAVLHPDEIEGWRGTIEDGEVVQDHETAVESEEREGAEGTDHAPEDELTDEDYGDEQDDMEDEYQEADGEADAEDEEDEGISPNGRPTRSAEGARRSRRDRRPAGRPQRSGRSSREDDRTQRTARRVVTRGRGDQ
jgi:uncharacterized membrane protein